MLGALAPADLDALGPAALKALILAQHGELLSHKSNIDHLKLQVEKLRRMLFGASSEKIRGRIEQLELELEELELTEAKEAQPTPLRQDVASAVKPHRQPLSCASAARSPNLCSAPPGLSGLWRQAPAARRRRGRDVGVRACLLQGDPPCASQAELCNLRSHHAGKGAIVAKRLGINKRVGWYTFRRTYTTLLHANGEDVKVVQELVRHSSSRITMDVYAQAQTPAKRAAQQKVVEIVRAGRLQVEAEKMA